MPLDLAGARIKLGSADEEARRAAVAELSVDARGPDGAPALALLVDAMGDASWRVRKEAAARAAEWGDRAAAAEALTVALGEPDNVGRRNAAVEGLTTMGEGAVAPIVSALAARPEHRKVLVDTLGLIGDARAASALAPLLGDADPNVRVAAAEALGSLGGAEAEAALRSTLSTAAQDRLLALAALDGLNRLGAHLPPSALEPLFDVATLRAAALEALGRSGDEQAIARLERALADPARSTREAAIRALAELCRRADPTLRGRLRARLSLSTAAMQSLVQALMEGTLGVQRAAVTVLGLLGRVEAVRPLVLAVADPELCDGAIDALVTVGPAAVDALVTLAPDLDGRLRGDVFRLLPRLGPAASEPKVQTLLADALGDEDLDAAAGAAQALGEVGGVESLAPLVRACARPTTGRADEVAASAAAALGQLGTRYYDAVRILVQSRGLDGPEAPHLCRVLGACGRASDVAFLRGALGGSSSEVRRAAAEALAQLPPTGEADDALLFALADESVEVRAAAARALGAHAAENPARVIDPLERAAHDGELAVRGAAVRALGAVARAAEGADRAHALAVLRRLADAPEPIAAVPALEALGQFGEPSDDARLIAALDSADAEIVKVAARALGHRARGAPDPSSRAVREALDRALSDRRWDVRRAAAQALGEHGASAHPLLYARRTVERDPLVLEAIDSALGAALDARAGE